jgi:hypothetical protein
MAKGNGVNRRFASDIRRGRSTSVGAGDQSGNPLTLNIIAGGHRPALKRWRRTPQRDPGPDDTADGGPGTHARQTRSGRPRPRTRWRQTASTRGTCWPARCAAGRCLDSWRRSPVRRGRCANCMSASTTSLPCRFRASFARGSERRKVLHLVSSRHSRTDWEEKRRTYEPLSAAGRRAAAGT